jgi:hypothetical protein
VAATLRADGYPARQQADVTAFPPARTTQETIAAAQAAAAEQAVCAEFPDWTITQLEALGMWEGFWRSPDGRVRWSVIAPLIGDLLAKMRAIRDGDRTGTRAW